MGFAITAGSAVFAASLKNLNGELARSYHDEAKARESAQMNERTAIEARNQAIEAAKAEAEAKEREKHAREKAEALVQGAFAQNRNALEAQRVLSVLLNQRLLSIQGTQGLREELINTTMTGLEATIASLEQLGTVARDKEGFALATRTLAGINQRAARLQWSTVNTKRQPATSTAWTSWPTSWRPPIPTRWNRRRSRLVSRPPSATFS